jgi:hypothetical protein
VAVGLIKAEGGASTYGGQAKGGTARGSDSGARPTRGSDSGASPTLRRPEVGDDRWPPPIGDCGREGGRADSWAASWAGRPAGREAALDAGEEREGAVRGSGAGLWAAPRLKQS